MGWSGGNEVDFFVSYTQADLAWAEWIAWQLEDNGLSTTIQAWDFHPGCNFILEMDRAAGEARRTIAVLSKSYVEAAYTHPEWASALARDPIGENAVLLPIRVREFKPTGLLAQIVYLDLVGLTEDEARARLIHHVNGRRGKPQTAPPFAGRMTGQPVAGVSRTEADFPVSTPPASPRFTVTPPDADGEAGSLSDVEQDLAPYVGPVAKLLVRRASRRAQTPADLYAALAASIPHEGERQAFLRRAITQSCNIPSVAPTPEADSRSPRCNIFAPRLLERLSQELAVYLGPIARFTIDRETGDASTLEELYQRLCRHLPAEAERLAFLGRLPRAS